MLKCNDHSLRLFTSPDNSSTLSDADIDPTTKIKCGIQVPVHIDRLLKDDKYPIRFLSDPIQVLDFDFSHQSTIPGPEGRSVPTEFVPTKSGKASGVLFWWEIDLFGNHTYSTKPGGETPWQDHWHQCLYVFPNLPKDCQSLVIGQQTTLISSHNDTQLHFALSDDSYSNDDSERESKRSRLDTVNQQVSSTPTVTPQRCWQMNDLHRSGLLRDGIQSVLNKIGVDNSNVLDVSDFSLCGIISALLGARYVTSIESSSSSGLSLASARVAQIGNGLPLSGRPDDSFQMIQCHAENLTSQILGGGQPANIVVGEPYYQVLEGYPVQEALNFLYTIRMLKRKDCVHPETKCVPRHASILACGVECFDIGSAYCKRDVYGGFDHTAVTKYCQFGEHTISIPLYEYNHRCVTETAVVANLDFENATEDRKNETIKSSFITKNNVDATVHCIMFWVEYDVFDDRILSTSSRSYKQEVCILPVPISSKDETTISINPNVVFG
jgi:hypothetical protein